ncbi:DUF7661 family protein [Rugamonas violacea]
MLPEYSYRRRHHSRKAQPSASWLCEYLADLYHENATPRSCNAVQLT